MALTVHPSFILAPCHGTLKFLLSLADRSATIFDSGLFPVICFGQEYVSKLDPSRGLKKSLHVSNSSLAHLHLSWDHSYKEHVRETWRELRHHSRRRDVDIRKGLREEMIWPLGCLLKITRNLSDRLQSRRIYQAGEMACKKTKQKNLSGVKKLGMFKNLN